MLAVKYTKTCLHVRHLTICISCIIPLMHLGMNMLDTSGIHIQDPGIASSDSHGQPRLTKPHPDSEMMLSTDDLESSIVIDLPVSQTALSPLPSWDNIDGFQTIQFTSQFFDQFEPQSMTRWTTGKALS
jgi:hypothetical protein